MLFISPWLGESLAFVTGVVTIFFLVRSKELRQNIWHFLNYPFSKKITKDKYFTVYLFFMLIVIVVSIFYTLRNIVYLTK
jgi:type IV secretory pathway TraG/TraD family ATPase VirD4